MDLCMDAFVGGEGRMNGVLRSSVCNLTRCRSEFVSSDPELTLMLLMSYIYIYIYIYMEHLFLMFLDHTQRRTTVGRTPLDE